MRYNGAPVTASGNGDLITSDPERPGKVYYCPSFICRFAKVQYHKAYDH